MATKRKQSKGRAYVQDETTRESIFPGSGTRQLSKPGASVTTRKEMEELIEQTRRERESGPEPIAAVQEAESPRVRNRRRVDPSIVGRRKRAYSDGIDDFELAMARHGISMDDIVKAAKSFELGTTTPYAKLAHAVISWWCSIPMGGRRIVWVDPDTGYTEGTLPKFSTAEGQDLITRGLAGGVWVSTRKHLLEARAWAKRMLQLTPTQRLDEPIQLGDERLTRR